MSEALGAMDGTTKAYRIFEVGMGQEVHKVGRVQVGGTVYNAIAIAPGPMAFDIDAPNGGTVKIVQADSLTALAAGNIRMETWTFTAGNRLIKGITPIRKFMAVVVEGQGLKVEPRPLGSILRGPSSMTLAEGITAWAGV